MRSGKTAGIALGVSCLVVVTALVLRLRLRHADHDASAPPPVGTKVVATDRSSSEGRYVGVVLSERTVDVVARVDGLVVDVSVKLGQRVVAGTIVAQVDVPKLQHELATASAAERGLAVEVSRATAEVTEADRLVAFKEKLLAASVGSEEEVETARYQQKVSRLRVAQAEAKLEEQRGRIAELRRDLEATKIRAPLDGVIAARYVDPGTSVATLGRIVRIVGDGKPIVRFAVPQSDVERVRVGSEVLATGTASGARISARIEAISPEVDSAANMLFVEAQIVDSSTAADGWHSGELVHVTRGSGG